jgi:hypothetical protein
VKNPEKVVLSEPPSFEELLEKTCERLWDKKRQYTLRRLRELDDRLCGLEQELEQFFGDSPPDGSASFKT